MADSNSKAAQVQVQDMQLAQILSDLVSLRPGVCDPAAALALVSARSDQSSTLTTSSTSTTSPATAPTATAVSADHADHETDPELRRARELVHLHYTVRERCRTGELGRGLAEARRAVEEAMG